MNRLMTHPSETDMALYAGIDLGWLRQFQVNWHVRDCSECQQAADEFSQIRSTRNTLPEVNWNRMALEMKANIRLGLAAGECVGFRPVKRTTVSGQRLVFAGALLTVLFVVGVWVGGPALRTDFLQRISSGSLQRTALGTVLEGSGSGIQVRGMRQTLRILNPAAMNVVYSVGAQGELRARSLDPETGNVAITHVYGD